MGLMDKVKSMLGQHGDRVEGGIDRGGDLIDEKTGGKHATHVDKGQDAAKDDLRKLDGEGGGGGGSH
ncbi:MAG TPA: antitoxin [Acidimicrobiales bacterium]|nr:antitoxin [Acidimicrobiales bacterium]